MLSNADFRMIDRLDRLAARNTISGYHLHMLGRGQNYFVSIYARPNKYRNCKSYTAERATIHEAIEVAIYVWCKGNIKRKNSYAIVSGQR